MKTVKVPFVPGDNVWTYKDKCIKESEVIKCPDCGITHIHDPRFKMVPVSANVEKVTIIPRGWTCEVGWREAENSISVSNFRGSHHIWITRKEAQVYCDSYNNSTKSGQ